MGRLSAVTVFCHRILRFVCLTFGLTTSPRVFSKVLLAVIAHLRGKGLRVHHYLDDVLLLHQDPEVLQSHSRVLIATLQRFGWIINWEKSQLSPTQSMVYLGALIDTLQGQVSLPNPRVKVFRERIQFALSRRFMTATQCLWLVGTLVATIPMVKWAQWNLRSFQANGGRSGGIKGS